MAIDIDIDKIAQDAINTIAEKIKDLKTLNIIVAGKTVSLPKHILKNI